MKLNPFARWFAREPVYDRARFAGDLGGGIIAALIALPYGLAMASLIGMPPVMGILASILAAPLIALFGRNPVLIGGTANATVPFLAQAYAQHGAAGAALLAFWAGLIMVAFGFLHVGRRILHVPHAVIAGFSSGIGGLMIISQLYTLLGIPHVSTGLNLPVETLVAIVPRLAEFHAAPLVIGVLVIVVAGVCARISPFVPGPLLAILVAMGVIAAAGWQVAQVGPLPSGMVTPFGSAMTAGAAVAMLPAAVGLAFVASINVLVTARVVEHFRGHHAPMKPADADGELRAFGVANAFAALFGAPTVVANPARSIAVVRCGGTTPVANVVHAFLLVGIFVGAGAFVVHIPLAALAGLTVWIALSLLNVGMIRRLHKMRRTDAAAFVITAVGVLCVNSVWAVMLGCAVYAARNAIMWVRKRRELGVEVPDGGTMDDTIDQLEAEAVQQG